MVSKSETLKDAKAPSAIQEKPKIQLKKSEDKPSQPAPAPGPSTAVSKD